MAVVNFDMSQFREFFQRMDKAAKGDLREEMETYLEAVGFDFLRVVQDEIVRRKVVDTRLLLSSFERGGSGNVWQLEDNGLTLEVGTNVKYAKFVEDGHWTNPEGVAVRFVPGIWKGDRFIYKPGAKTGMVLKQKWVEGRHYFESALRIYRKTFQKSMDVKMQQWLDTYFAM